MHTFSGPVKFFLGLFSLEVLNFTQGHHHFLWSIAQNNVIVGVAPVPHSINSYIPAYVYVCEYADTVRSKSL